MRRHQVLTGAVNPGKHCFSVGSIASFTFWAYGSGCDLVILGVDLQPIHIIAGHVRGYQLITCLDCCQFCGKIAVSYGREIVIYHPKLIQNEKDGVPVFTWIEEATWTLEEDAGQASVLSWASSGERLLIGCKEILLWQVKKEADPKEQQRPSLKVQFSIEEIEEENQDLEEETPHGSREFKAVKWELAWSSGIQENPFDVQFSPDDTLFASVSRGDSVIKVWHERFKIPMDLFKDLIANPKKENQDLPYAMNGSPFRPKPDAAQSFLGLQLDTKLDFTFTYLIHPKPIAGFSWRKGVPLLPNGSVPNVLISSCHDNMCRIWCETLTPETDITKLAAVHATSMSKQTTGKKRHLHPNDKNSSIPVKKSVSAPMIGQNHEHASEYKPPDKSSLRLFRHFHIAATINPTSDIPLLPSISSMDTSPGGGNGEGDGRDSLVFTVHWLDNKHHYAMAHLNKILHETMSELNVQEDNVTVDGPDEDKKSLHSQNSGSTAHSVKSPSHTSTLKRPSDFTSKFPVWDSSKPESIDAYLSCLASPVSPDIQSDLGLSLSGNVYDMLRRAWLDQSDALFAIHPTDGSLLVWHVSYLDENRCGEIRQAQVSFSSRIPMAIPARDASTLCSRLVLYANHYSAHLAFNNVESPNAMSPQRPQEPLTTEQMDKDFLASDGNSSPSINLLSKHSDGSLNQWEISFSTHTGYSTVSSIAHRLRFCGHRYHLSDIFCHPTLPLLLTTSRHRDPVHPNKNFERNQDLNVNSELILWRVDPVGALCRAGGITELARLNGHSVDDFVKVAWFPVLFPSWCLGPANTSPSSCFLSLSKSSLRIYQAVIDAEELLDGLEGPLAASGLEDKIGSISSRQSSSQPGCVLLLEKIPMGNEMLLSGSEILLLSIFPENQFSGTSGSRMQQPKATTTPKKGHSIVETFYVVLILKSKTGAIGSKVTIKMWKVNFTASFNAAMGGKSRRGTTVLSPDSSEVSSDDDSVVEDVLVSQSQQLSCLNVSSCKLPPQVIHHPPGEEITLVSAARDPFSMSMFQEIQPLPFSILTASKTGHVYFWRGSMNPDQGKNEIIAWTKELKSSDPNVNDVEHQIEIGGTPVVLKMAHCCMLACLSVADGMCHVSVYECLSSGGSEWRIQDKIAVGRVSDHSEHRVHLDWISREDGTFLLTVNVGRKVKIYAQLPAGMRWEDISGSNVAGGGENKEEPTPSIRPLLKRQSTLDAVTRQKILRPFKSMKSMDHGVEGQTEHLLHWSLLSEIAIGNSLGLSVGGSNNTNPVVVSWVRDGLLLIATETEMHLFCHWMEQMDKVESSTVPGSGRLYGNASLSHSTPEGLCQYLMQDPNATGGSQISDGGSVVSLMSIADDLSPCLPQYHPLVLSELTNGGHLGTVKHILINLAVAINRRFEPTDGTIQVEPMKLRKFGLVLNKDENDLECKETLSPLLLHDLLDENGRISQKLTSHSTGLSSSEKSKNAIPGTSHHIQDSRDGKSEYDQLFTTSMEDEEEGGLDLILDSDKKPDSPEIIDLSHFEPGYLGPEHCQVLHNYLSRNLLPGLSSLDQMELMAIADTVANTAFTKQTSDNNAASGVGVDGGGRGYASSGNTATESMDQCGLRFVFAMHNHLCLLRSLPALQRTKLLQEGLGSCHFAWAFHSDAEEEMLSVISSVKRGSPEWDELRSFGAGWWIRSTATLRRLVEQTARAAFQKDNNPLAAAIFYMALNKKNVLKGLFKSAREERMMQFFAQDFKEERWHRAALKNAFALMGKQRFQEAAAFFLLANSVQDAVEVCIDKMNDYQLASIIVRLYDQDKSASSYSEFLQKHVIGDPSKKGKILPDPFIRSMAYWHLGSYDEALKTLLDNQARQDAKASQINITDIFNFYNFLRTHPLIMRQKKIDQSQAVSSTDQQVDDSITMEERMLFFATAASHLESGCPLLTLDVLSTLPPVREEGTNEESQDETDGPNAGNVASSLFDNFEQPAYKKKVTATATDWGDSSFDIGIKEELELDWSDEESDESEKVEDRPRVQVTAPTPIKKEIKEETPAPQKEEMKKSNALYSDTYAHQLRLMACLKIFVSELKCMATSYHSDGGQIREELHKWLEKETDVLRRLSPDMNLTPYSPKAEERTHGIDTDKSLKSDFSSDSESEGEQRPSLKTGESSMGGSLKPAPSLHELYLAEKQDWKIRRERIYHRRRWLRQYRRFLRTLLSYCGLHDDARGSLSPLRIELLLLLQDSLQERSPQQLSSPVPNPTTIPLLSSSVVACRTVVAEPTERLSSMAQDILTTVLSLSEPPPYPVKSSFMSTILCRQAEALASCIYQSLCDTNSKNYRARLLDKPGSPDFVHYPGFANGQTAEQKYVPPGTTPSQWPGVVSLQALLNSESSDNRPKLIVLLCESLVAVYVSLLVHGLQTCNSSLLYRLVSNSLSEKMWNAVFGGGARVVVRYSRPPAECTERTVRPHSGSPSRGMDGNKVRDRLNRTVLAYSHERQGSFTSIHSADSTSFREKFVAPETTLWDFFLSKPLIGFSGADEVEFESDSDPDTDSSEEDMFSDDDNSFSEFGNGKPGVKVTEHGDPNSYSWHILRLAVIRSALNNLKSFLPTTGLELCELGISSPMLNNILQLLSHWQITLAKELEAFVEPPPDFIKGIQTAGVTLRGRPAILKHQAMLDPNNTPFSATSREALGARRLWHCLVQKENLQELFIRYIFHKKTSNEGLADGRVGKVKILHKENEIVSSFCVNNANASCVVLATSRDIQELDVSTLLACDSWSWIEEDMSTNLTQEELQKQSYQKDDEFLIVSRKQSMFATPTSTPVAMSVAAAAAAAAATSSVGGTAQTGQGATMLLKRGFSGVRRMTSHPTLPYYLTGHHDGSIRMWEWGHQQQISQFRATGQFPKVTNLHFSSLGNKIAAVDADGYLSLWQVSSPRKPYLYHQCHDRSATDCCFMSSTSVLATTGLSTTNRNVAIWDTLLPPRSMLVKDFTVHEGVGATCVAYAAQSRTLVVGGRDGKVSLFDLRRADDPMHCFFAHEGPIKCVGLSPDNKLFVTGAVVGDVRVWDISSHLLVYNLSGEHTRTSIFRNFGSGTMKVEIASPGNRVFSCGADGTLKLRILPHDEKDDFGIGYSMGSRIQKMTLQKQVVKLANAVRQQCLAY